MSEVATRVPVISLCAGLGLGTFSLKSRSQLANAVVVAGCLQGTPRPRDKADSWTAMVNASCRSGLIEPRVQNSRSKGHMLTKMTSSGIEGPAPAFMEKCKQDQQCQQCQHFTGTQQVQTAFLLPLTSKTAPLNNPKTETLTKDQTPLEVRSTLRPTKPWSALETTPDEPRSKCRGVAWCFKLTLAIIAPDRD
jgi:hypothetical protein